ncbi:MAG: hypothetical protein ACTSRZ_10975 [Promethearchaeota archaeon]
MGVVIALTDIMPEEVLSDEEMDKLKEKIMETIKSLNVGMEACKYVPVAFGLKKFQCRLIIPESIEGGTDSIEKTLESIEGIQRAEIVMATRM